MSLEGARRLAAALLGALLLAGLLPAGASAQQDVPGRFDFYVFSLSWSPSWCETQGAEADREPQCSRARPFAFVVHGLWPQYARGFPQYCVRPAPFVPNDLLRSMTEVMPSRGLVLHQWRKHGTCSGLGAQGYFDLVRRAKAKVAIPAEFQRLNTYRMVAPAEVEAAFRAANPGLAPDMISVDCDSRRLREVRICMSRDLAFTPCPEVDRRACRLDKVVMPPVRGG
ncbi:ribonuclease T2 family protein [Xanthobacter tagetidis]|uniref:Ribonuclease T n=1 Tax=Xanthobacter tagetidis TaxID=60216 RepID=A0A3L7A6D7_9HYPH|nr:ribonuclease T2 [Xanthobacter tagetidis]MBB6307327.1 ribonuclease T2 [Xanthobacter tagetidis]RLP75869.1 ribonuclease T [Xanthobacter tagetidis]